MELESFERFMKNEEKKNKERTASRFEIAVLFLESKAINF